MPVIIFDDLTFGGSFQSMEHARACGWGNLWQANKMHFSSPGLALNIFSLATSFCISLALSYQLCLPLAKLSFLDPQELPGLW